MGSWDYALAWLIYFSFGCVFAWQLHRLLTNWGVIARRLVLGSFWVLAFTPWEIAEYPGYFAPALVTLVMDLLLRGASNTLEGGLVLLIAYLAMTAGVLVYAYVTHQNSSAKKPIKPEETGVSAAD